MKTKEIKVNLQGRSFSFIVSEKIKTEDFWEIINYVDDKYSKIKGDSGETDIFRMGILLSVNIAEEYFSLKKENVKLKDFLKSIDRIISPEDRKEKHIINFSPK